ncbi:hypothetical protein [Nocardiopsis tropica]|uniref:Tautomerase cis-CaaD-like domain-containing protein n=1 Tax=Nocardiopsis tropica TaxID=109330 RepID=A0ABU7KQU7_9ACTN|nr:hypothetical protein [Nocardiopsis umidischolae]MEE2051649.1 hypothetical protein [Nocardiopsis umidischolae]
MTTYHYVLTIQYPLPHGAGAGFGMATDTGTIQPGEQQTRGDVYRQIVDEIAATRGAVRPNVIFFSLEPNVLGGAR